VIETFFLLLFLLFFFSFPINYIVPMDLNYVHNVQQVKKW
jgi:hypothetical protein